MKIYYCSQRSKEWYELRCGRITASNFHCMLSNCWTTHSYLIEKAMERLTFKNISNRFWTPDLQRGIDLEPVACEEYERVTGNKVDHVGFIVYDDNIGSSPDGLVGDDGLIEIKCPNEKKFWEIERSQKVAPAHFTQMQFNMFVSGRKWCDYVVYSTMETPIIVRVDRDNEYIAMLEERAQEVNIMIDRYVKKLGYTINKKSLKFKKIGELSGFRYVQTY